MKNLLSLSISRNLIKIAFPKFITSLLVLCFLTMTTHAQYTVLSNAKDQIKVYGLILDKDTKEPIPYAHVGLPKQGLGTTSGNNGYFELKIPAKYKEEVMTVSFMGYKTYRKKVKDIKYKTEKILSMKNIFQFINTGSKVLLLIMIDRFILLALEKIQMEEPLMSRIVEVALKDKEEY